MEPQHAADFQMANIARAVLAENVLKEVRDNFERARKLHLHGVLEYEFFIAAGDYVPLVLEGALRVRFLAIYNNEIPQGSRGGTAGTLAAYGLTAAGTGWVPSWACTQVEVQERCRERTERGEYGVDDYSERCCTSARVTVSGGR